MTLIEMHDARELKDNRVLITGGAGFVGSHLASDLMSRNCSVIVLDNLSSGNLRNVETWLEHPEFIFVHEDLLNSENLTKAVEDQEIVFHLAANPEVRTSVSRPEVHYQQNILATFNLLEAVRKVGNLNYCGLKPAGSS